jgi:hypothetical protein
MHLDLDGPGRQVERAVKHARGDLLVEVAVRLEEDAEQVPLGDDADQPAVGVDHGQMPDIAPVEEPGGPA